MPASVVAPGLKRGSVETMSYQVLKCCETPKLYSGTAKINASAEVSSSASVGSDREGRTLVVVA